MPGAPPKPGRGATHKSSCCFFLAAVRCAPPARSAPHAAPRAPTCHAPRTALAQRPVLRASRTVCCAPCVVRCALCAPCASCAPCAMRSTPHVVCCAPCPVTLLALRALCASRPASPCGSRCVRRALCTVRSTPGPVQRTPRPVRCARAPCAPCAACASRAPGASCAPCAPCTPCAMCSLITAHRASHTHAPSHSAGKSEATFLRELVPSLIRLGTNSS